MMDAAWWSAARRDGARRDRQSHDSYEETTMNTSPTISAVARSRSIRALTIGVALIAAGALAPAAMLADDATFDPPTRNERSIAPPSWASSKT